MEYNELNNISDNIGTKLKNKDTNPIRNINETRKLVKMQDNIKRNSIIPK